MMVVEIIILKLPVFPVLLLFVIEADPRRVALYNQDIFIYIRFYITVQTAEQFVGEEK
jgi:hypothetical protein